MPYTMFATFRMPLPALLAAAALACSKSTSSPPAAEDKISVGGTYQTSVSLIGSTCTGTVVQTFPTIVTHTPGATTLVLTHAGSAYPASLNSTGSFVSTPRSYEIGGSSYMIGITGQFSTTAVDAVVTVQPSVTPPCEFSARWQGPKVGGPNVLP